MQSFSNILVGVDLTRCRRLDSSELDASTREAIGHAVYLAKLNGARLLFFSAMNISEEALHHLEEDRRTHVRRSVEEQALRVLDESVQQARQQGVDAHARVVAGKGWLEIIRQVLRADHDLVVVGAREPSLVRRMLFGNTGIKLLRRCPCPVWIVKGGHGARPLRTLVASALGSASVTAVRLGLSLGAQMHMPVHILHVLEYPLDYLWGTAFPDQETTEYHAKVRADAEAKLQEHLWAAGGPLPGQELHVHLMEGVGIPDVAIQNFIKSHDIDLLVMGTIARAGVVGIMIGNTAERLLPEVQCSVLAIKPVGFKSPVNLEENE